MAFAGLSPVPAGSGLQNEAVDELGALLRDLRLNERRAPAARAAVGGAGAAVVASARAASSAESRSLVPEMSLGDFLRPRISTAHVQIPTHTSDASLYLSSVERNILAEYACFIKTASPEA